MLSKLLYLFRRVAHAMQTRRTTNQLGAPNRKCITSKRIYANCMYADQQNNRFCKILVRESDYVQCLREREIKRKRRCTSLKNKGGPNVRVPNNHEIITLLAKGTRKGLRITRKTRTESAKNNARESSLKLNLPRWEVNCHPNLKTFHS